MPAEIIRFPNAPINPIAHYIRLGESGYKKLADLHAAGRLPATRVVVDASRYLHQKDLIASLKAQGAEIVLDTKAAELAAKEKFGGYAKHAPWAAEGESILLGPEYYQPNPPRDIVNLIAQFAVEEGVDAILAPAHYINDPSYEDWLHVDYVSCLKLRQALDRAGGSAIAIDYPLIISHTALNSEVSRGEILSRLSDLPIDNLWIRASGFGSDAAPLTLRRYLTAMASLHNIGKPIIADYLGGLAGMAALAFGAVSGIAHGVGERERFNARTWHKEPKEKRTDGFGRKAYVLISSINRSFSIPELQLLAQARGGRKLVACGDRRCCMHGLADMIGDPRRHAAYQSFKSIDELTRIPDLNREQHFINGHLNEFERNARQVKDLKLPPEEAVSKKVDKEKLEKRLMKFSEQASKMQSMLEDLHEENAGHASRARPVESRTSQRNQHKTGRL